MSRNDLPIVFFIGKAKLWKRDCIFLERGLMTAYDFFWAVRTNYSRETLIAEIGRVASQLMLRMEGFHGAGFIHRDIKLSNFILISSPIQQLQEFKLADLGLAMLYLGEAGQHIPTGPAPYVGTPTFSSKNADEGIVQSRRDDMESLAYSLINVARSASLPWDNKPLDELRQVKAATSPQCLCEGLPPVFVNYLLYCFQLKFDERPDYGRWSAEFARLGGGGESCQMDLRVCSDSETRNTPLSKDTVASSAVNSRDLGNATLGSRSIPTSVSASHMEGDSMPLPEFGIPPQKARTKHPGPLNTVSSRRCSTDRVVIRNFRTIGPRVPHFALPTISQLARQKPPIRVARAPSMSSSACNLFNNIRQCGTPSAANCAMKINRKVVTSHQARRSLPSSGRS
ncbi:hypothetical protein M407DRAFT_245245 [Tulasnella calospora MUT 4182]|uniref:non-specific serine/threonine protein kinase n=1 Tax=Tulasnella calospora MUT 4182 TaxID=1051891 RepID=A0A0C3Q1Q5_9AGAM|nr:hypothetical protein M407DRAFT_245245 [Tulasnella calospora MUT 4182]